MKLFSIVIAMVVMMAVSYTVEAVVRIICPSVLIVIAFHRQIYHTLVYNTKLHTQYIYIIVQNILQKK